MQRINFTKMVASGNDFVVLDYRLPITDYRLRNLARSICDRKLGIGADGLLLLEKSKKADIRMRIFNPDGSEPSMCGNGARCVALYSASNQKSVTRNQIKIETKAGIIEARIRGENVKIRLLNPKNIRLDIPIKINNRRLKVNFINTGVAHTVVFVEGLDKIDVFNLGRQIRYHKKFAPQGTNVDFVEILSNDRIKLRTYERGVEDETLACGTGAVAAAIITEISNQKPLSRKKYKVNVKTKGSEILKVYFKRSNNKFKNLWLEGKARIVYEGVYYV